MVIKSYRIGRYMNERRLLVITEIDLKCAVYMALIIISTASFFL